MSDIRDSRINGASMDIEQSEKDKLQAVFPQCFEEGKLNIDRLLNLCGEYITNDFEKFTFQWKGKVEALQMAQNPSMGTLRPCEEDSVDWENTENLYFEGDNLEVLKLLQKTYYHKIKMIYIDPPYNTGSDFIYEDDFKDPMNRYKEVTKQTTKSNPESMGRFHTNWLSMMYPRLRLAVNLLRDDGVIFISIDDHEVHHLRKLCDQVFGEENFFVTLTRRCMHTVRNSSKDFNRNSDFILVYAKNKTKYAEDKGRYIRAKVDKTENYKLNDDNGKGFYKLDPIYARNYAKPYKFEFENGVSWEAPQGSFPRYSQETLRNMEQNNELNFAGKEPRAKRYLNEVQIGQPPDTFMREEDVGFNSDGTKDLAQSVQHDKIFDQPKPTKLIKYLISLLPNDEDDIILDFFSGSATTAHAVMQLNAEDGGNRKFIMIQLPELCEEKSEAAKAGYKNICEIGKERIRRAGTKIKAEYDEKQAEKDTNQTSLLETESLEFSEENSEQKPLDTGFRVFKLDTSNMIHWDNTYIKPKDIDVLIERMSKRHKSLKLDRSELDIVYEIMLKIGIPLTETVTAIDFDGITAYSIYEDCLVLVCFEENVPIETVEEMAQLYPARMIFGQKSFPDLTAMSNAKLSLRQRNIELQYV